MLLKALSWCNLLQQPQEAYTGPLSVPSASLLPTQVRGTLQREMDYRGGGGKGVSVQRHKNAPGSDTCLWLLPEKGSLGFSC